MFIAQITNNLQMSPCTHFHCSSIKAAKLNKYKHEGPSDSYCSIICLLLNPHHLHPHYFITNTPLKNFILLIRNVIITYVCVHCFSRLVLNGPHKSSWVRYTSKHGVAQEVVFSGKMICIHVNQKHYDS
jgi:hypothetical protein